APRNDGGDAPDKAASATASRYRPASGALPRGQVWDELMLQNAVQNYRQGRTAEARRLASGVAAGHRDYQAAQLLLAEIAARENAREAQRDHLVNAIVVGPVPPVALAHALKLADATSDAAGLRRLLPVLPQRTNEVGLLVQAALTALRAGASAEGIALLRTLAAA